MPPLYLSAMSLYIIYICSVTLYTTLQYVMPFHFSAQWIIWMNGHFVSSMRWEGGLIAYFNLPCHFNFPPTHSRWNSFPPWEKLRKHNAVPNVRWNAKQWKPVAMQQHPDQCRTEILPCHRTAKKTCSLSDRLCIFQFMSVAKISQINYLELDQIDVSQCVRPYRTCEYVLYMVMFLDTCVVWILWQRSYLLCAGSLEP